MSVPLYQGSAELSSPAPHFNEASGIKVPLPDANTNILMEPHGTATQLT